jgi:hypothetical protein
MSETREAAKLRLQKEGRWKEALAYREQLKKDGVSPAVAHGRMLQRFPPLAADGQPVPCPSPSGDTPPAPAQPVKRRRRKRKPDKMDLLADVNWVYLNLSDPDDKPPGAPTPGALGLLKWARSDTASFFRTFVVKLLPKNDGSGEQDEQPDSDAEREDCARFLDDLTRRFSPKNKEPEAEAAETLCQPPQPPRPPTAAEAAPTSPPQPLLCSSCQQNGPQPNCGRCYYVRHVNGTAHTPA